MSAFNLAQESADAENTEATAAATEQPESETSTAALSEANAVETEVAQEDDTAEQIETEQDQLGEIEDEVAQESNGLSPVAARLLSQSLRRIVGKQQATKIHAMESYQSSRSGQMEARRMALEGIKETLKQFWEAIKAQLKKFYNKVKTYFVKAFSAARKLKDRAEALQKKANSLVGSIEEKSFSFGQTKAIAIDGKYNDPSTLTTGLNNIRKWIQSNLTVSKADTYESAIEKAQTAIEGSVKEIARGLKDGDNSAKASAWGGAGAVAKALKDLGDISISPLSASKPEAKLLEMYAGGKDSTDKVAQSASLPGGKSIFAVVPDLHVTDGGAEGVLDWTKRIKNTRLVLGNDKYQARDVTEGEVKTLTTSQVDKICDDIIEIAESCYTYEKAWEKRDKFQSKLEREVDSIVKDANSANDEADSRQQRLVRGYATAFTSSVRRRTSFESQFIGYALNTGAAFLNYGERSLSQHKSK